VGSYGVLQLRELDLAVNPITRLGVHKRRLGGAAAAVSSVCAWGGRGDAPTEVGETAGMLYFLPQVPDIYILE
jgi:hypothetical protein